MRCRSSQICVAVLICVFLLCRLALAEDSQVTFVDPARNISFSYDGTLWQAVGKSHSTAITTIWRRYRDDEQFARCELRAHKSDYATRIEGHVRTASDNMAIRFRDAARRQNPKAKFLD